MKKEVVFDIEADNLLNGITKVWVIACVDVDGTNQRIFTDQSETGPYEKAGALEDGVKYLLDADKVICHNVFGYDWFVLNKFWPKLWNLKTAPFKKCWDTLVQSKAQHYDRQPLKGTKSRHGLEYYGVLFNYPKPSIEDWSYWDADKLNRCLVDIEINRKAYYYLNKEASKIGLDFHLQIRRTAAAQFWYTRQELNGWTADKSFLIKCRDELDTMTAELAQEIEPLLPAQIVNKTAKCTWEDIRDKWDSFFRKVPKTQYDDKGKPIKEAYLPTLRIFLKKRGSDGEVMYDKHTANHFNIAQEAAQSGFLVMAPYTKIEFVDAKMSQHAVVKDYLLKLGWIPTQWNFKKDPDGKIIRDDKGKPVRSTPKLTEDSFDSIEGELGQKIAKYNTLMHRRRTIENENNDDKGWLNQLRSDGKINAGAMAWATSTSRAAQFGIVNVPSSAAVYGAPMRQAWVSSKGHKLVSVDMDSAQLRLLANYMEDPEFTKAVVEGIEEVRYPENEPPDNYYEFSEGEYKVYVGTDAHTFNARFFGLIDDAEWEKAKKTQSKYLVDKLSKARKKAKNGIYALLFGSGDERFAITVGYKSAHEGKAVKDRYFTRLPKLKRLIDKLVKQMRENPWKGGGYIQVAGGCWVWCHSEHKILNYLLMGSEAQLQNEAICWVNMQNSRRGLHGKQLAAIHDELNWEFPVEEIEDGKKLLTECYSVASRNFKLNVPVTGTAQAGGSWNDVH